MGNAFNLADHDDGDQSNAIVGYKKAVVLLYSSEHDPTIAHVDGVKGMMPVKVSVTYNTFLPPVLKEIACKYPQITGKAIYLILIYLIYI